MAAMWLGLAACGSSGDQNGPGLHYDTVRGDAPILLEIVGRDLRGEDAALDVAALDVVSPDGAPSDVTPLDARDDGPDAPLVDAGDVAGPGDTGDDPGHADGDVLPGACQTGHVCAADSDCAPGERCNRTLVPPGCQKLYCSGADEPCDPAQDDLLCAPGLVCVGGGANRCCAPDCAGKACGDDGCGGACGACAPGLACQDFACTGCAAGATTCTENDLYACNPTTHAFELSQHCAHVCWEGACRDCVPGTTSCQGQTVGTCNGAGTAWTPGVTCDPSGAGEVCRDGACVSLCAEAALAGSSVGCEFWAVDLDQIDENGADDSPFAVVVANVSSSFPTYVRITRWQGGAEVVQTTDADGVAFSTAPLAPGQRRAYVLPPRNVQRTTQARLAWRVTTTLPVVAYQFNPLGSAGVFSTDASLLLPAAGLGKQHTVLSWPERTGALHAYLAVTRVGPGPATVTVTAAAPTLAGTNATTGAAIAAMGAGESRQFVLQPFDVLSLATNGALTDLTGTSVTSDVPVAVYSGTECSNVPDTRCVDGACPGLGTACTTECPVTCCCDHLEEQLLPKPALGKTYVAYLPWQRNGEPAFWRLVATEPDTHVVLDPPLATVPVLQAGDLFELEASVAFTVTADRPVLAGQFLAGSFLNADCGTCEGGPLFGQCSNGVGACTDDTECCAGPHTGDPSFTLLVPSDRFLPRVDFVVPDGYASDYVAIVATAGSAVTLDGDALDLDAAEPVGSSGSVVLRRAIADGFHTLTFSKPGMAYVHGYDVDVSYSYPAAAGLAPNGVLP